MRGVDQAGKPRRLAVFDLETTGIDVDRDRIVTCFIGLLDGDGVVFDEHRWLLDPGVEIPDGAQAVHGISTSMARTHGQPASSGVQQITTALQRVVDQGVPVVAHNGGYDHSLLTAEARRHGVVPVRGVVMIDTYVIDKALDRYRPGSRRLTDVAAHYGVALGDAAHDAGADAIAAGRIALALYDRFPERLHGLSPAELHRRQIRWAGAQARDLTDHLRRTGRMGDGESVDGSWPLRSGPGASSHAPHDAAYHPARVLRRGHLALPGNAGQFASRVRTAPPDEL